jgi:hypothetical protein
LHSQPLIGPACGGRARRAAHRRRYWPEAPART